MCFQPPFCFFVTENFSLAQDNKLLEYIIFLNSHPSESVSNLLNFSRQVGTGAFKP